MKPYRFPSVAFSALDSFFRRDRREFSGGKRILAEQAASNLLDEELSGVALALATIDHYTARLLYEYKTREGKEERDYSKKVYLPADYRVNSTLGTISKFALDHVGNELFKNLEKIDVALFDANRKEERLLIQHLTTPCRFVLKDEGLVERSSLIHFLDGKKILVISPYGELVKVQHLHQHVLHREMERVRGDFELLVLSTEEIFKKQEAYSLFEKLDALKVEILKYDFDLALLDLSLLGLPVTSFIADLNRKALDLEELLYPIFGIVPNAYEKSKRDNFWVDLNSYRRGTESTFLATGVIGAPIKIRSKRGGRRVH